MCPGSKVAAAQLTPGFSEGAEGDYSDTPSLVSQGRVTQGVGTPHHLPLHRLLLHLWWQTIHTGGQVGPGGARWGQVGPNDQGPWLSSTWAASVADVGGGTG